MDFSKNTALFKENLRRERKAAKLTQAELGKMLGVSGPTVNGWETGARMPGAEIIVQLAKIFDISCDDLLGFKSRRSARYEEIIPILDNLNPEQLNAIVLIVSSMDSNADSRLMAYAKELGNYYHQKPTSKKSDE